MFCSANVPVSSNELIETLWNVNTVAELGAKANWSELIETLWNVNSVLLRVDCMIILELIETLWNVNIERRLTITTTYAN